MDTLHFSANLGNEWNEGEAHRNPLKGQWIALYRDIEPIPAGQDDDENSRPRAAMLQNVITLKRTRAKLQAAAVVAGRMLEQQPYLPDSDELQAALRRVLLAAKATAKVERTNVWVRLEIPSESSQDQDGIRAGA